MSTTTAGLTITAELPRPRQPLRIGVISQWYDPEGGSAAVVGAICRALALAGYEVHVLTGFPNYPGGNLHAGYRIRPYQYEWRDGVHVHRVPLLPGHDRSALRRALTYLSFGLAASARWRLLRAVDAWLVFLSPATAALPALVARARYRRPYGLLIQDIWPDTVAVSGLIRPGRVMSVMLRGLRLLCDRAYRHAAAVVVTAPGMARLLRERGVPAQKLSVVPNWVDESLFRPVARDRELAARHGLDGFVVMYAGSLGDLQGLETAVIGMRHLADLDDLRLVFVGTGVAEQRLAALAGDDPRIRLLGQQPPERMARLLGLGDVQLVSLRDLPLFHATLPSKLQAAMACARPVVGTVPGDAARLIEDSGCGVVVPPGDPLAFAGAIRHLYKMDTTERETMGAAGQRYYQERLCARVGSAALAGVLAQVATGAELRSGREGAE